MKKRERVLLHMDCMRVPSSTLVLKDNKKYYLLGVLDDDAKTCWVELMDGKSALTVMFGMLKSLIQLKERYGINPTVIETDNAGEFCAGEYANDKDTHPVERYFTELEIKHKYTNTYRPQQNGEIDTFWQKFKEEFLLVKKYRTLKRFKEKMIEYILEYNKNNK